MKWQVKEFSKLCGVSVRTLHYYDEIGLLTPAVVDKYSGYRHYDDASLLRMQEILFYRELNFSLKQIREILLSPNYDKQQALAAQKTLLTMKKARLERLIAAVDGAMKGENIMSAFENKEIESYKQEVKERWGNTAAHAEYNEKSKGRSPEENNALFAGMESILADFAACKGQGNTAGSPAVQELVKQLQNYISDHFYTCTKEILAGLGQMYTADERFRSNIDMHGAGTAEFISTAIAHYCA